MPSLSVADVRREIASGRLRPLYLILGPDESAKVSLAAEFLELVEPELRAFNVDRAYGGETTPAALVDAARTLPLMAPRRIVLVTHAERLLAPKRESEAATRDLETLERYIKAPVDSSTIVMIAGELDRRRSIAKLLSTAAAVVECHGPVDGAEAVRWIRDRVAQEGMAIEPRAARLLADRAGPDVGRLRGDLERLLLYAAGSKTISLADALEIVGPASSQDDWGVTRAIERGSAADALSELGMLLDEGIVPYVILGQLGWFVRTKLPAQRVPSAVDAVFRTDLALKTSAGDARAMLERLVLELCGV